MSGSRTDSERETGVVLGFLEEAERWQLASSQFPSKVGGKPAWLSLLNLPTVAELVCETCQLPTVFLLQVYAPIVGQERSFHRTLYVFCCKTPACYTANDNRCFKGKLTLTAWNSASKYCTVQIKTTEPTTMYLRLYSFYIYFPPLYNPNSLNVLFLLSFP